MNMFIVRMLLRSLYIFFICYVNQIKNMNNFSSKLFFMVNKTLLLYLNSIIDKKNLRKTNFSLTA